MGGCNFKEINEIIYGYMNDCKSIYLNVFLSM